QLVGRQVGAVQFRATGAGKAGIAVKIFGILVDDVRAGGQPVAVIFPPFSRGMMKRLGQGRAAERQQRRKADRNAHSVSLTFAPRPVSCISLGRKIEWDIGMRTETINGHILFFVASEGPALSSEQDALDLLGETYGT